jgi:hypothetical protein
MDSRNRLSLRFIPSSLCNKDLRVWSPAAGSATRSPHVVISISFSWPPQQNSWVTSGHSGLIREAFRPAKHGESGTARSWGAPLECRGRFGVRVLRAPCEGKEAQGRGLGKLRSRFPQIQPTNSAEERLLKRSVRNDSAPTAGRCSRRRKGGRGGDRALEPGGVSDYCPITSRNTRGPRSTCACKKARGRTRAGKGPGRRRCRSRGCKRSIRGDHDV